MADNIDEKAAKVFKALPDIKPGEFKKVDCPVCGGKETLYCARSGFNGHWFVNCECGVMIIQ